MLKITIHQTQALTPKQQSALPPTFAATSEGEDNEVAQGIAPANADLIRAVFQLGQQLPNAQVRVTTQPTQPPAKNPWDLLEEGDVSGAELAFVHWEFGPQDRDHLRKLYQSDSEEDVALACRVAGIVGWKSFVTTLRTSAVLHPSAQVRRDAATAIGRLAGPSLVPTLQRMLGDSEPMVQNAAKDAIYAIEHS